VTDFPISGAPCPVTSAIRNWVLSVRRAAGGLRKWSRRSASFAVLGVRRPKKGHPLVAAALCVLASVQRINGPCHALRRPSPSSWSILLQEQVVRSPAIVHRRPSRSESRCARTVEYPPFRRTRLARWDRGSNLVREREFRRACSPDPCERFMRLFTLPLDLWDRDATGALQQTSKIAIGHNPVAADDHSPSQRRPL